MTKKTLMMFTVLLLAVVSAGVTRSALGGDKKADKSGESITEKPLPARVSSISAEVVDLFASGLQENGTVQAVNKVEMRSKISGRLEKMLVRQGDSVTKGQALAVIEHRSIKAKIAVARADIAMAAAQLKEVQVAFADAGQELARYEKLFKNGYCTEQELTSRRTTYETERAKLAVEKASIERHEASLDEIRIDLEEATIRASIDGVITNDYSRTPGEMIYSDTPIAELVDLDRLYVRVAVAEQDAYRVKQGMSANIEILQNGHDSALTGTVWRIKPTVEESSRTTRVDVLIDNPSAFRPGMFASVFFVEEQVENATVLPKTAIRNDEEGDYIWISDNGAARIHRVELELVNGDKVSIKGGLPEATRVLVSGINNLKDGDRITDSSIDQESRA